MSKLTEQRLQWPQMTNTHFTELFIKVNFIKQQQEKATTANSGEKGESDF